jgi:hypothetical protein
MNSAMKVEPESSDANSMWLELCMDGESHTFELKADELRAVAVGSLLRADLRIDRPGVAPVQFHIERDDGALWIVPAYNSSDLRVDTARVTGPQRIDGRAVIEFAGVRIHACVLDVDLAKVRGSLVNELSMLDTERSAHESGAVLVANKVQAEASMASSPVAEPGVFSPTVSFERFVTSAAAKPEALTERFSPVNAADVVPVQRTVVIEPIQVAPPEYLDTGEKIPPPLRTGEYPAKDSPTTGRIGTLSELPAQDTISMAPYWMTQPEPECAVRVNPSSPEVAAAQSTPAPADNELHKVPTPVERAGLAPSEETAITTCFEPLRTSSVPLCETQDSASQSTTVFDVPFIRPQEPDTRGWLVRLGLLSKRRPLVVWLVGTVSAFILSASIGFATKHLHHTAVPKVGHSKQAVITAPPLPSGGMTIKTNTLVAPSDIAEPVVVIPAVSSLVSSKPKKKGQTNDPELVAAVGHLIAGRYKDAQAAYTLLAVQSPSDPSLATVARLLAKKLDPKCSSTAPVASISCPEVKP